MKRILVVAIAAVFTVAFAVSAMADVKISGEYRLRMEQWDNVNMTDNENTWDGWGFCIGNDVTPSGSSRCNDNGSQYGQRVRLSIVATPTDDTEIKITLQDTRVWGENWDNGIYDQGTYNWVENGGPVLTGTGNTNGVDLHEAYLAIKNIFGTPISAKIGRQELNYGDQRLIGSFGWSNNGRSFDAWKLSYNSDVVDVDFVNSKIAERNAMFFSWGDISTKPGDSADDKDLYILYATVKAIPNNTLDLYYIWLLDNSSVPAYWSSMPVTDNGSLNYPGSVLSWNQSSQELVTYGFRFAGAVSGIDYTLEMPFQTGQNEVYAGTGQKTKIDASAMAVKLGYTIPGANKLRVGFEYDQASGDNNRADNKVKTFSNLYPTNHDKYGTMDLQGWRNMKAWSVNVSGNINEKLSARLDYWDFSLDSTKDDWYGAGHWNNGIYGIGYGIRQYTDGVDCGNGGTQKCSDEIGNEIDLTFNYKYNAAVGIQLALSRFMPGDAIKGRLDQITSGNAKESDMDWYSLQITGKF